jgi:hypothetical protein
MSQRKAAVHYEICRSTIKYKLENNFLEKKRFLTIYTVNEERGFSSHIVYHRHTQNASERRMFWVKVT